MTLENLLTMATDQDVRDKAYFECGWIYLKKGLWEEAKACFDKISPENRGKFKVEEMLEELSREELFPQKNPNTAGFLAVLPGAGHLYTGRPKEALASFLVNGALIFAAYQAFRHEQYALGGVIAVVGVGFYTGNIYSAVNSAHKFNRDEKSRFLKHLKERTKVNLAWAKQKEGGAFMASCEFVF
jgi:hypothetical protein